jgi:hypothetical protein
MKTTTSTAAGIKKFSSQSRFTRTGAALFFLLFSPFASNPQQAIDTFDIDTHAVNYDINSYMDSIQPCDFSTICGSKVLMEDFVFLRKYRVDKEQLKNILMEHSYILSTSAVNYESTLNDSFALKRVIDKMTRSGVDTINVDNLAYDQHVIRNILGLNAAAVNSSSSETASLTLLKEAQAAVSSKLSAERVLLGKSYNLRQNMRNIDIDVLNCNNALTDIYQELSPQYQNQSFKKNMSIIFSALVAMIMLGFFCLILFKSGNNIGGEIMGSVGLQFITLFVLITAVILFGILGILQATELAAILSGISGYILGKGLPSPPNKPL